MILAALALGAALLGGCGGSGDQATPTTSEGTSTETTGASGAGAIASAAKGAAGSHLTVTALEGKGPLAIYAKPGDDKPTRTLPNPLPVGKEKKASVPLVMLAKSPPADGFIEVYLPVRPNGSTGFVRESDVQTASHDYRIEVKLSAFNLKAFKGDEKILDTGIAVAADNTPTPGGLYYTNQLLQPPDPNGPYGSYAYGLSGYSDSLTEFDGGDAQLGIHGTNQPDKIGTKVSHGCIRLRNADIERLAKELPLGVPVTIEN